MRDDFDRRDILRGIGAVSSAGMLGLAGCTLQQTGNGGSGDGTESTESTDSKGSGGQPDALVFIGYPASGIQLFKDYYSEYSTGTDILVTDGLQDPKLPEDVGHQLTNVIGTAPTAAGPGKKFFTKRYKEEYGREPGVFTSQAYDATASLLLANLAGGKNSGTAVRDNLRGVSNPAGPKFGPENLAEAVETAAAGKDLKYIGASSSVDYDDAGDMKAVTYEIFSFTKNGDIKRKRTVPFKSDSGGGGVKAPPGPGSKSGRTVKIGMLMALTGDLASVGKPIRDGALLPVKQLKGNIDFTIDAQVADAQTQPQAGISAANSLVNSGYPAVVGPLSSGVNIPVCKSVYIPNEVVGCSPSSTSPKVTTLKDNDYVFRTAPSDALQGQVLAQVASKNVKARTVSVLYVNNDYGQALADVFERAFEEGGGKVPASIPFQKEQSSYAAKLQKAMNPSS
jgi:ABC-type branched-subunit amino acid transport system substrate-binding protein